METTESPFLVMLVTVLAAVGLVVWLATRLSNYIKGLRSHVNQRGLARFIQESESAAWRSRRAHLQSCLFYRLPRETQRALDARWMGNRCSHEECIGAGGCPDYTDEICSILGNIRENEGERERLERRGT